MSRVFAFFTFLLFLTFVDIYDVDAYVSLITVLYIIPIIKSPVLSLYVLVKSMLLMSFSNTFIRVYVYQYLSE